MQCRFASARLRKNAINVRLIGKRIFDTKVIVLRCCCMQIEVGDRANMRLQHVTHDVAVDLSSEAIRPVSCVANGFRWMRHDVDERSRSVPVFGARGAWAGVAQSLFTTTAGVPFSRLVSLASFM